MMPADIVDIVTRLAETGTAMAHLRRMILALALCGELDGAEAVEAPEATLALFAAARQDAIKKQSMKPTQEIARVEPPPVLNGFSGRTVERLSNLAIIAKGATGIQSAKPGPYPLVVTAEGRASCDHFDFEGPAAIVPLVSSTGHGHASIHRLHYQEGQFALGNILCAIIPLLPEEVSARFLYEYLTAFKQELLVASMVGTANVSLTLSKVGAVPVPLVSRGAQKRVGELVTLCDEIEAKRAKKREVQARLRTAALDALTSAQGIEEIEAAWARIAQNFTALIDTADDVAELRAAILTLALKGRLVVDGDCNESALQEIAARKPGAAVVPIGEQPYALPPHWCWLRLEQLLAGITDGDHQPPPQVSSGINFLTISNVTTGTICFDGSRFVPRAYFEALDPRRAPKNGDILYTVVGATYGRPIPVETDRPFCVQRHIAILRPDGSCDRDYLILFLRSPFAYAQATASLTGTAQPTVPLKPLRRFVVPVPPREEQRRIVARVGQLTKLCDDLESKLRRSAETASKLVESIVAQLVA